MLRIILPLLTFCLVTAPLAIGQSADPDVVTEEPAEGPFVRLLTGEVITGDSVTFEARNGVPQYVTINGRTFPNFQVHSFRADDRVYGFAHIHAGRPAFLVRQANGRVSLYREINRADGGADYFHVGTRPIRPTSGRYLRQALADNPEAMRYLERERMYGHLGTGAFVIGAGLVVAGLAVQYSEVDGPLPTGVVIAGSGVALAAAVNALIPGARASARRAAIREYNR